MGNYENEISRIGERISLLLKKKNMTQKELAEKAGITEAAVSHYIKGDRIPRSAVVAEIATVLETTADYLVCGANSSNEDDIDSAIGIIARNISNISNKQKRDLVNILIGDD
ncbi:MAG: helix-turn-helix domain-containing protein [Clostridia bacterium]|nr:helix-turn-helix domain-containing protein [Clostridia bacterium]